jgi:arabinogalactan endo-1,4-beta-galactosidase
MVQVGNEITPGMLLPDGSATNWDPLAELLTAGLTAVKEVDPEIQTVLHLDRGNDNLASRWWFDEALSRGVKYADNHRAANDVMFNFPRGLGTFIWEPTAQGEWDPGLFVNGAAVDTIHLYDQMAEDCGLR